MAEFIPMMRPMEASEGSAHNLYVRIFARGESAFGGNPEPDKIERGIFAY